MFDNIKTVNCPVCGHTYKFYPYKVGDQSICPGCASEAENATKRPDTEDEINRRKKFYGSYRIN
jgi:predicted Zn-ribbon and HTH transcriptional regulator